MSYSNLTKDVEYMAAQDEDTQIAPEYSVVELLSKGREGRSQTTGFRSELNNRQRIMTTMYNQAVADGDQDRATKIKTEQDRYEQTDTTYWEDLKNLFPSSPITSGMKIYQEIQDYVNPILGPKTEITQEYIDKANDEIIATDKEISKIDGFWNNVLLGVGGASVDFQHPAFIATLPLSFYSSTGKAAVGATAAAFVGKNALYSATREFGLAAVAESFIQYEAYKYSQVRADESRGIKAMTLDDVALNTIIVSAFAGVLAGTGSTVIDYTKIKLNGSQKFRIDESVQSYIRTRELSGVDYKDLQNILSRSTFDQKIDLSVVMEIKKFMDSSPSADMNLHTASISKAAKDIETKGFVDFTDDDITTPIVESNAGDYIGIRDNDGNSKIGKILKSTDDEVTIQYGDKEVTLNKESGEVVGENKDGLYSAAPQPIDAPVPKNVNKVTQEDAQVAIKEDGQKLTPEDDAILAKYKDDEYIKQVTRETDDDQAALDQLKKDLGLELEPKVKVNDEVDPLTAAANKLEATPDDELINNKYFKEIEDGVGKKPQSQREGNEEFSLRMESLLTTDGEDAVNEAWRKRITKQTKGIETNYTALDSTDTSIKRINKGKGIPEDFEKLRADLEELEVLDINKGSSDIPETITIIKDKDGNYLTEDGEVIPFAKFGPELLGGSVAGIEEDENGNITLDPAAFVIGMVLGHTAKRLALNPKIQKGTLKALDKAAFDLAKKYPALFDINPKLYAGETATGFKDAQVTGKTVGDTADKKEKFWIDDIGAEFKQKDLYEAKDNEYKKFVFLDEAIKHDELFKQYPELKDIKIMYDSTVSVGGASFDGSMIKVSDKGASLEDTKSSILHEVQHAIQDIEGFATGGSAKNLKPQDLYNTLRDELEELPFFQKKEREFLSGEITEKEFFTEVINTGSGIYEGGVAELRHGTYQRLAGEQEARAVQAKLKNPELDPYAALAKEEGGLKKPIVQMENQGIARSEDYKMDHIAPTDDGYAKPGNDITEIYPDDIYGPNGARYYGHGDMAMDEESIKVIRSMRDNPDKEVTIYRAMPKDVDDGINTGDWITLSKTYAKGHGESYLENGYKIESMKVKAKDIYTDGNSIHEWGYDPTTLAKEEAKGTIKDVNKPPRTKVSVSENDNFITLSKIEVDEDVRGQGRARIYMKNLMAYADESGKKIALTPSADFGAKITKLKKFYKDLGFIENKGKKKDFETTESFIYVPKGSK